MLLLALLRHGVLCCVHGAHPPTRAAAAPAPRTPNLHALCPCWHAPSPPSTPHTSPQQLVAREG